ncbi:spore germination protein GerPC [Caldibacillus lycopersici]|uniref:Spore germination protein GerPC n=1 Tax=Perspicuibacillus lycopersici TaxID=1325689 RepID=A0AAE3LPN3_9BACI|nr:spore germination protein GerPC [Perspicuibacillus lycopersici]MCU9612474.1 spore germination protein GerPC [Perspicuibacillus lycopersici]
MQNDLYYYLNQLAAQIQKQEAKIKVLEDAQSDMKQLLESLKNNQAVNIERIDYHFDQLKIEKLEGTLNIGVNPNDLQNLDEFAVGSNQVFPQASHKFNPEMINYLENELLAYMDNEVPQMVDETKREFGLQLDDSYTEFIKQDIRNQLKQRIDYYLRQPANMKENISNQERQDQIIFAIQNDIKQAINSFFSQFPMKGDESSDDFRSDQS